MNKHLTKLLSGYQDLLDRYGSDDALVRDLKAEIDRYQHAQDASGFTERRSGSGTALADAWERHSEIASL